MSLPELRRRNVFPQSDLTSSETSDAISGENQPNQQSQQQQPNTDSSSTASVSNSDSATSFGTDANQRHFTAATASAVSTSTSTSAARSDRDSGDIPQNGGQFQDGINNPQQNNFNPPGGNPNIIQINLQVMPPRVSLGTNYARVSSRWSRSVLELILFAHAVLALVFLIYVQQRFLASSIDCIEQQPSFKRYVDELELRGLPLRDYVVRVHAQYGASRLSLDVAKSIALERLLVYEYDSEFDRLVRSFANSASGVAEEVNNSTVETDADADTHNQLNDLQAKNDAASTGDDIFDYASMYPITIFEYSNVVGYLQLSHEARARLNVTVLFFALDLAATGDRCCVRTSFERALFDWLAILDYNELVLTALKTFVTSPAHVQLTAELPYRSGNVGSQLPSDPAPESNSTDTAAMDEPSQSINSSTIDTNASDAGNQDEASASTESESENQDNEHSNSVRVGRGYIKNVLKGELYQLVPGLSLSRLALFVPFTVMLVFTGAVSMLLQYARSQLYLLYFNVIQLAVELIRNGLQVRLAFTTRRATPAVPVRTQTREAAQAAPSQSQSQSQSQSDANQPQAAVSNTNNQNQNQNQSEDEAGQNVQVAANVNAGQAAAQAARGPSPRANRRRLPLMMVNTQLPPAVNVILAFIGVQAMMIEFFDTELTALCVMMLVWMSDEYLLLLRSSRGRSEWLKCFYLCHFLVYAFHYRFSGHYTELSLYASFAWMLFFMIRVYHSYELPLFTTRRTANANVNVAAAAARA